MLRRFHFELGGSTFLVLNRPERLLEGKDNECLGW